MAFDLTHSWQFLSFINGLPKFSPARQLQTVLCPPEGINGECGTTLLNRRMGGASDRFEARDQPARSDLVKSHLDAGGGVAGRISADDDGLVNAPVDESRMRRTSVSTSWKSNVVRLIAAWRPTSTKSSRCALA
ncbi:MAG TPA: hypothetical protein VGP27_26320 [Mycobacterium sp.]|nr:hypothetical protein [Mycobacterium sp.]